jgi:hypothetical protein
LLGAKPINCPDRVDADIRRLACCDGYDDFAEIAGVRHDNRSDIDVSMCAVRLIDDLPAGDFAGAAKQLAKPEDHDVFLLLFALKKVRTALPSNPPKNRAMRRVRRTAHATTIKATNLRISYPLIAPIVRPLTNCFWAARNTMRTGMLAASEAAMISP